MPSETTQLDQPIDVMYLIHKAIRAEARCTRQAAEQLEIGGNFKSFMHVFHRWALALGYHEETEYKYIVPYLPQSPPARHNEIGHRQLLDGLEDLQRCLHEELGRTVVIPRTQRQLFGKVITLLIAQADLLEEEEEVVLPMLRQHFGEEQQLEMARRLLFDPESADERWMLNWVAQHLSEAERQTLADLVVRFASPPQTLPGPSLDRAETPRAPSTAEYEPAVTVDRLPVDHPIDVMYLIHKTLSADARRVETMAERLAIGENLQPFLHACDSWIKALGFHATMEDTYMTSLLPESPQARDNEAVHARLGQRIEALQTYLQEIEQQTVTARTRRRLFGKVVALRIDQDDHLEEEEEFVLPVIREYISTEQQLEMARRLLLDLEAPHEAGGWVLDWLVQDLTDGERQGLADLRGRFDTSHPLSA
jgi:hemerythrin-like domain-containing protein